MPQCFRKRDRSDRTRTASLLTLAENAVLIDTTDMPIDEVVQRVLDLARERTAAIQA
jgi:CMP/dCMP kinase